MKPRYLRFMTLNLWGENGPWEERLVLVGEKLTSLQPDVVALQEVREVPGRIVNQAATLAAERGYQHVFAPSTEWGGGQEGLAILSRFPIGAHEVRALPHTAEKEGRIVLSARIDSDFGQFWAHTTHLSYRENEGRQREDQVQAVDEAVSAHKTDNPQILMGDFNAVPHSDEMRWLCGLTTLGGRRVFYQDTWDVLHANLPGYTWARANAFTSRMALAARRPPARLHLHHAAAARRARHRALVAAVPRRADRACPTASGCSRRITSRWSRRSSSRPTKRERVTTSKLERAVARDILTRMFRLAHVTDPHFRGFDGITLGALVGKRAIGLLNLAVNRAAQAQDRAAGGARRRSARRGAGSPGAHRRSVESVARGRVARGAALARAPGRGAGDGDGHSRQPRRVRRRRGARGRVRAAVRPVPERRPRQRGRGRGGDPRARYPFVRLRGPLALIGVNSCVATGDLGAWGEVGADQLARLEALLANPEVARRVRVVLIHHPPVMHKGGEARNLKDRDALAAVLARAGADIVLARPRPPRRARRPDRARRPRIPVVGAGSASYAGGPEKRARYNIYELDESGRITVVTRAHDEATDRFKEVRREVLPV